MTMATTSAVQRYTAAEVVVTGPNADFLSLTKKNIGRDTGEQERNSHFPADPRVSVLSRRAGYVGHPLIHPPLHPKMSP
jgi:hypothetical protein